MKTLKVKPVGTAMVPDFKAAEAGVRRYIGRRYEPATKDAPGGFVPDKGVVEVPFMAEYVQEVKAGCLEAADEETAKICGVPFKPSK